MNTTEIRTTNDGLRLVRTWAATKLELERARSSVNRAECAVSNAETALVKWAVPEGAKVGETYCVPVQEAWLDVRIVTRQSFSVGDSGDGGVHLGIAYEIGWRGNRPPKESI